MSTAAAEAFIDRLESDGDFAKMEQIAAGTDPAVIAGTVVGVAVWVGAASAAALA